MNIACRVVKFIYFISRTVVSRFTHHGRVRTVLRRYEYKYEYPIPSTITQGLLKVLVRRAALRAAILNAKFNVHTALTFI